ncbi:MAG: hypothetical protein CMK30_01590 [Porticoccaceae bacterium]|nr:hypothetical protein [Porticoccaceae bacterium]
MPKFDISFSFLSLFAASSTLICCAMPALFVALGAGASVATLVATFPLLVSLSKFKIYISVSTFIMLIIAGYFNYVSFYSPCPLDPELGKICLRLRKRSRYIYYFSWFIFICATIFTYLITTLY